MNNVDRTQWIMNDEGLYNQYRFSRLSMRKFITQNKEMIDEVINNVLNHKKPAHYLAYGG
jgi:hypothetical protein